MISPLAALPPLAGWQVLQERGTSALDEFARQPQVQRQVEYFRANIAEAKTPKDLVRDQRLFEFALTAFGLEDKRNSQAFMRVLLEEDPLSKDSMANKLADPKFRDFAMKFNYPNMQGLNLSSKSWKEDMVERFMTWKHEQAVGERNPAMRQAMYFARRIGEVENWYDVLGDKPLYEAVRQGLNLPDSMAGTDVDRQKAMFERKIDLAELKGSKELQDKVARTFLARAQAQAGPAAGPSSPALSLMGGVRAGMVTISLDLSNQLMNLR